MLLRATNPKRTDMPVRRSHEEQATRYAGARLTANPGGASAAPQAARVGAFVQGLLAARGSCARAADVARLFRDIEGGNSNSGKGREREREREKERKEEEEKAIRWGGEALDRSLVSEPRPLRPRKKKSGKKKNSGPAQPRRGSGPVQARRRRQRGPGADAAGRQARDAA